MRFSIFSTFLLAGAAHGMDIDVEDPESIKAAAKLKAKDVLEYYHGEEPGKVPGILPGPPPDGDYYWWQAGALWGALIDYWHYTGDGEHNDLVERAMQFQTGPPDNAFMPNNWTASLGNDDQGFWGMSAMGAAEYKFQNPPKDKPQWLALAQAVFTTQAAPDRHDDTCGGGMRWQIPPVNNGYNYKNSIANGCFFNLGARLARYTGNDSYAEWANKTYEWMESVKYIDEQYNVYDGGNVDHNCTDIVKAQFTYNAAIFLQGAAFMWNYTEAPIWKERVNGLTDQTLKVFFPEGIAKEISCESEEKVTCNTDMLTYKGYIHRWLATVAQLAPYTSDRIMKNLKSSAKAALAQCTGGATGRVCGFRWVQGTYDGTNGASQEMSALGALLSLLGNPADGPVTNNTGGTSEGDYNAGKGANFLPPESPVTGGDKAGAGILTTIVVAALGGILAWMATDFWEED